MFNGNLAGLNIFDLRRITKRRIPKWLFEFIDRGCEDEISLRNNREALERIGLIPRMLVDVSARSQATEIFGRTQAMPIAIAPTGIAGMLSPHGDLAIARAARNAGIPFTLATASTTSMETIVDQAGGRLWFQLYMWADRSLSRELVRRVSSFGFEGLVVTVDGPVAPNREHNLRNGFTIPLRLNPTLVADTMMHPRWLFGVIARYLLTTGLPRQENYPIELQASIARDPSASRNDSLTWDDLRELRELWRGKLIVKGILHPDDARQAAACGVDAVIVSNHGGRNLDGTLAPIEALPDIVSAVGDRLTVMIDGGFRRGSDVVKAIALGAKLVLIGRATLYGAAVAGQAGASHAIRVLHDEVDRVMALLGCPSIAELDGSFLRVPTGAPTRPVFQEN